MSKICTMISAYISLLFISGVQPVNASSNIGDIGYRIGTDSFEWKQNISNNDGYGSFLRQRSSSDTLNRTQEISAKIAQTREYYFDDDGFAVEYPSNWSVIEKPFGEAFSGILIHVAFGAPLDGVFDDFIENINILSTPTGCI